MANLKYTVIKDKEQYKLYCSILEKLVGDACSTTSLQDEIELLTLLIEKYDEANSPIIDRDPIELLRSFMEEHQMKSKDIVQLLGVSKGYISDILNYRKGLSKEVIRKLAQHFKVRQEAFNRPYKLMSASRNASIIGNVQSIPIAH